MFNDGSGFIIKMNCDKSFEMLEEWFIKVKPLMDEWPTDLSFRLLVTGDRNYKNPDIINHAIFCLPKKPVCIIEGEATGADSIAREVALEYNICVQKFPADWKKYGKAAGPKRNKEMLEIGRPTLTFAFHDDIVNSKGTRNMIEQSLKNKIPVILYHKEKIEKFIDLKSFKSFCSGESNLYN